MSHAAETDVTCPCGEEFPAELWSSVNAASDPGLRELILAGQLNVVKCASCGQMVYAERFVLYHDPADELMAFVYPSGDAADGHKWRERTRHDFREAQKGLTGAEHIAYEPVTLFGLDALVAILQDEQESADQAEILSALAPSLSLEVRRLKPHAARAHGWPTVVPLGGKVREGARARLEEGLDILLRSNDQLSVYARFRDKVRGGDIRDMTLLGGV